MTRMSLMSRWPVLLGLVGLSLLPLLLPPALLNAANQMLIAALFASAYNVLAGQAGMLGFGHSAYFGVGAFATIHAMNAFASTHLVPTPLMPVLGALAGCVFGVCAGWFATQRVGVYFSMITLALAELLHALAPQLKSTFGGEAGISSMRSPAWGISFGSDVHVYYLTLFWTALSVLLLLFYTTTPLGRLTLGLRENGHRLRFLGYNVHRLRLLVFVISTTFAGVAGSLQALTNESANYILFDIRLSSEVVLNSYIGGVGTFLGPALGAALMTFFGYAVSDLTRSWLLYQGILFVLVMMYMPLGLSGAVPWWKAKRRHTSAAELLPLLFVALIATALLVLGAVFLIELLQRIFAQDYRALRITGQPWPPVPFAGRMWSPGAASTWALPIASLAAGVVALRWLRPRWRQAEQEGQT